MFVLFRTVVLPRKGQSSCMAKNNFFASIGQPSFLTLDKKGDEQMILLRFKMMNLMK